MPILTLPCRVLTCPGRARCSGLGWSWSGRWRTWHSWRRSPGARPQSATPPAAAWPVRWQLYKRGCLDHKHGQRDWNTHRHDDVEPQMLTFWSQDTGTTSDKYWPGVQLEQCGDYPFSADIVSGEGYQILCTFRPDPACPISPLMSKCPPKISEQTGQEMRPCSEYL